MARKTRRRKSKKNAPDPRQMSLWGNDDDDDDDDTNETASSEVADVVDANDDMPTEVIAEIHPAIAEQPVAPVLKDPKVREVQQPAQPMRVRIFDPSHEQPPSPFFVPPPAPIEPITSISVTSFRTYLESPYRFYLRHVKHLQPADDRLRELDPMRFGNLIHEVLEAFGHSSERSSTSIKDIDATLMATLDERVENRLGRYRTAAVNVQIEQIRLRLKRFAVWQAKWVKDGWRIFYVEKEKDQITATLEIETGRTMGIHGRIDRIDQNVNTGEFAILDYKTGNDVKNPIKTHLQNDNWIDLQLPLYTILAKELEVTGRPKLGYIAVPASLDKVGDMLANWQPIDIEYAISVARDVADRIQKQEFGDLNNDKIKADYDDFSRICQMTVRSDV